MSWLVDAPLTFFQKFWINVLKCGPIPKHVAFIMDGNRRFAKKLKVEKSQGHSRGFEKLAECLQWCFEFGINEVTVYAFSIENFKRSQEEVDTLLGLAREKFKRLFDETEKLMEHGVCIRVIGNLNLLPDDLKQSIAKSVLLTKDNNKAFLNVAFAYTSRDEIVHSIQTIVNGIKEEKLEVEDINEDLINQCMYTNLSRNPDILIRTSGEVRLSDFLLWQCSNTQILFKEVLWPEFTIWHLMACIFKYQRGLWDIEKSKATLSDNKEITDNERVKDFINFVQDRRLSQLKIYANA